MNKSEVEKNIPNKELRDEWTRQDRMVLTGIIISSINTLVVILTFCKLFFN